MLDVKPISILGDIVEGKFELSAGLFSRAFSKHCYSGTCSEREFWVENTVIATEGLLIAAGTCF